MLKSCTRLSRLILLIAVLAVSACTAPKTDIEREPVELRFLYPYPKINQPAQIGLEKLYRETAEAYSKSNPGITVKFEYLGENEELRERLRNDDSPDMLEVLAGTPQTIKDALIDLSPLLQSSSEMAVDENLLGLARSDGNLPVLPYSLKPFVVIYNKDFFDQAQIPYPQEDWTWEQYREISKKLKGGSLFAYMPVTFDLLMASLGKSILSPDGETAVGYLDSPEAVRTLRWLNGYMHDDPDRSVMDAGLGANRFFSVRQTGMELGTYFSYLFYTTEFKDQADRVGVAPLPRFEEGKRANFVSFDGYGISAKSKHPQETWKFIEYLWNAQTDFVQIGDYFLMPGPSGSEAVMQDKDPVKSVFENELKYAVKQPDHDVWRTPELHRSFLALFEVEDEGIPEKLHEFALQVDEELGRLKIAKKQQEGET